MEVVRYQVSDISHVTPLSENRVVQNIRGVYFSFESYYYLIGIFVIKAEY